MTMLHSIKYENDKLKSYFYLFGIIDKKQGMFLEFKKVEEWGKILGLPVVPVVFRNDIENDINFNNDGEKISYSNSSRKSKFLQCCL